MNKYKQTIMGRVSFAALVITIMTMALTNFVNIEPVSAASTTKTTAPMPTGLGNTFMLGLANGSGELGWMTRSGAKWDARAQFLVGDVTDPGGNWTGWNYPAGQYLRDYLQDCDDHNYLPVLDYYTMYYSSPGKYQDNEGDRSLVNLKTASTMRAYFANFKLMLDIAAHFGKAVIIQVEPDFWGFISRASGGVTLATIPAKVASSGFGDVTAGLPDNAAGFAQALFALRNKYAPNVRLAYHNSVWGTGTDINTATDPDIDVDQLASVSARIYKSVGVKFDLLTLDVADRDAAYYAPGDGGGTRHWWDTSNRVFPNFERYRQYVLALTSKTGLRAMLIGVPIGNRFYRTENNRPGHYQDNRVEYFLGQNYQAHLQSFIDAGLIGIVFGPGRGDQTTYTDNRGDGVSNPTPINGNNLVATVSDDDGGYLRERARNYYNNGPLLLPSSGTPPNPPAHSSYKVEFDVSSQWPTASNIEVTLSNQSNSPVTNWTISWQVKEGEILKEDWNANCTQQKTTLTCTNVDYNAAIDPDGDSVSFGITLHTPDGTTSRPTSFVVNGVRIGS